MTELTRVSERQNQQRGTQPLFGRREAAIAAKILSYIILILGAIVMLMPLLWMVSTALKERTSIFILPPEWIPQHPTLENFRQAWEVGQLPRGFLNSTIIAVVSTVGEVFFSTLAGFAFARMRFPGRDRIFQLLLATLAIPGVVILVPAFILYTRIGWVNTWNPLIIPVFVGTPFAIFLSRQFFATLPVDLEDAAKVDGANWFQTYCFVFVPLARPILATLFVLGFIARWNDFLTPLIYLRSVELYPIPLLLSRLNSQYETNWTLLMAGATIALIPIVLLFFALQRYFVESVALTGSKG
ncbi:MAG: carbohydrate ABC transporter permease [Anaerolineae bacterium]